MRTIQVSHLHRRYRCWTWSGLGSNPATPGNPAPGNPAPPGTYPATRHLNPAPTRQPGNQGTKRDPSRLQPSRAQPLCTCMSGTAPASAGGRPASLSPRVLQRARAQVDNHRSVDFDTFKLDVALIASTDACFELASIGATCPATWSPAWPTATRSRCRRRPAARAPPSTRRCDPCLCAAGLMCMLRLRAASRRSTRCLW